MDIFEQSGPGKTIFADILLPVPIPKLFTYRIPATLDNSVAPGQRAIVQFGDRKILTGLIWSTHHQPPKDYEAKYILELLDEVPSVNELQFLLFEWIANYYCCTAGEVMNAALPSGLKLSSESMVQLHPAFDPDDSDHAFSEKEMMLIRRLKGETLSYSDIAKFFGVKHIHNILKSLVSKDAIILFEEVREKYKEKKEKRIRLTQDYNSPERLEELFKIIEPKPMQEAVVLKFLQHVNVVKDSSANKAGVSKKKLLTEDISLSSLNTLIKNRIFEEFETIVPRFGADAQDQEPEMILNAEQQRAATEILKSFEKNPVTLLHGITGSGKTEIYINLIRKALDGGGQVLYLLPEIALTTQIVQRLKKIFGASMGVYHSRFSDNERVEVWKGVLTGQLKFVVGVRSSVFLPFDNLGLIIVDEEHDPSYKQHEPSPRYNARDVAIMMGKFHHARVLLGSATPSVESYFNALQKKYGLVGLHERFGEARLPTVVVANMREERIRKTIKGEFSSRLLKGISEALMKNEQVIIFQNRRGYAPMISCEDCGWVPKCINCAVSLTYHQFRHAVVCHYCGYRESLPNECPVCTSKRIQSIGYGTEKIEEELNLYFPETIIQRMDLDTTRSKTGYETIIESFENGETDILVGTQMVTKGLDFGNVSLVGVFNADRMMHFPDFRSHERAYQLITQVSGRAGRKDKPGVVIIQTSNPDHPLLQQVIGHDFIKFYDQEIKDRQEHGYPPFTRLAEIIVKHTDKKICKQAAQELAGSLRQALKNISVLGPGEPMVSRIRNQYLMSTLIKIPRKSSDLQNIKTLIRQCIEPLMLKKEYRSARVITDVDPA